VNCLLPKELGCSILVEGEHVFTRVSPECILQYKYAGLVIYKGHDMSLN
jgi:hypothetical protein